MSDFIIDIALSILFRMLADRKIPAKYVKALIKLRDALNAVLPIGSDQPAAGVKIV